MKKFSVLTMIVAFFLSGCDDICTNIVVKVKSNMNDMSTSLHIVICYEEETYSKLSELKSEEYFKNCGELYSEHCENIDIFNIEPYKGHKALKYNLKGKKSKKIHGVLIFSKHINKEPVKIKSKKYKNSIIILKDTFVKVIPVNKINGEKQTKNPIKHNDILYDVYNKSTDKIKEKFNTKKDDFMEKFNDEKDKYEDEIDNYTKDSKEKAISKLKDKAGKIKGKLLSKFTL